MHNLLCLLGVFSLLEIVSVADERLLAKQEYDGGDIQDYTKDEIGDFPCYFFDGEQLFDLRALRNFELDWYVKTKHGDMIYFNLCKLVEKKCGNKYADNFAIIDKDGTCTELTDGNISATLAEPS